MLKNRSVLVVVAGALCVSSALAQSDVLKVSSLGFDPVDSTAYLQRAFDSGARKVVIDRQASDWIALPLFITNSNVEVVLEDGVVLKAKRGEYHDQGDCLIRIQGGVSNVVLRGEGKAVLAMNKRDYQDPAQKYAFSEWRHAVSIWRARDVTVRDLTILSSGGDGVYPWLATNLTLENLKVYDHHRQGMSPISVDGMTVRRCEFNRTRGTAPNCGIDMEPNRPQYFFTDVVYEDCAFNDNASHGVDLYFGALNGTSKPVSIVFRRCVMRGNKNSGLSFMTAEPANLVENGPVTGTVAFEDCRFERNGAEAVKIINHTTNGMAIAFTRCRFDARGSRAECAVSLSNAQIPENFGDVTFDDCAVLIDRRQKPFYFEAQPGIGIAGKVEGRVGIDVDGQRNWFDFAAFRAANAPDPSQVRHFKSATVNFRKIAAPSAAALEGTATPFIRSPFVFVQTVAAAGEHSVSFRSKLLRTAGDPKVAGVVQVLDAAGTDLGKFELPVGDFTYTFKTHNANVCRLEVSQRNTAIISVSSKEPGGALLADRELHFFHGANETFYFRVPAAAKEVLVNLCPEEPGSAKLLDASGAVADESPYVRTAKVLKAVRQPSAADEVWSLVFPHIAEDYKCQVGGDAVPLLSTERAGVIVGK